MKLGELVEKEELKDRLYLIVRQSNKDTLVFDDNIIEPASEILTLIISLYNKILEDEGDVAASEYGFKIISKYVLKSIQLMEINRDATEVIKALINVGNELMEKIDE